jgi:serine/threonine protein kinase
MKGAATVEAKDLLNRMMQPDPFKRITIQEIKEHPWFKVNVSRYLKSPEFDTRSTIPQRIPDSEIIDKLFKLKLNIKIEDRPKIEDAIKKGELFDF